MTTMRRSNDEGVSEVLGFILSFALSAVFLMIALNSFYAAKGNTEAVVNAVELRAIADRVSARVVEAALIGQEFPNATYNVTIAVPTDLNGLPYYVEATASTIYVNASGGQLSASASTLRLDAVTGFAVSGRAESSNGHVTVTYSLQNAGAIRSIRIHGE